MVKQRFKYNNRHNIRMVNTLVALSRKGKGRIEVVMSKKNGNGKFSPLIEERVRPALDHLDKLGAPKVREHALQVVKAAGSARLLDLGAKEDDLLSLELASLLPLHSLESVSKLPNLPFSESFLRRFELQKKLKALDSRNGDRMEEYVKLINDPSIDPTDLLIALFARTADMITIHEAKTVEAATTNMPGLFPVYDNWSDVQKAWADPMLRIYCPVADWGGLTQAYRDMRDNAMRYLHPEKFKAVEQVVSAKAEALARTNELVTDVIKEISQVFGLRVLVAYDYKTLSRCYSELNPDTLLVALRPFKGVGGLLNKSLKKGIPIEKVKDWSAATLIGATQEQMYKLASFLHEGAIKQACANLSIENTHTLAPVDKVANPDPVTLYQSVHVDTVSDDPRVMPFEFILRTLDMHKWADEGGASHDAYKGSPLVNGERARLMKVFEQITSNA
jgi:hypothetical protein